MTKQQRTNNNKSIKQTAHYSLSQYSYIGFILFTMFFQPSISRTTHITY